MTATEPVRLRIGVVGPEFMGRQHVDVIRAAFGVDLIAIADPVPPGDVTQDLPVYADATAMLVAERLDAVVIAGPNSMHVETAVVPRGSFQVQLDHFVDVARGHAEPLVSAGVRFRVADTIALG